MGVSLNYNLIGRVESDHWKSIQQEAEQLAVSRLWWCEPINFYGSPDKGVFGDSKVYRTSHKSPTGDLLWVDDNDNQFMSYRDIKFIIEKLADWSHRYGVSWQLMFYDSPAGKITPKTTEQGVAKIVKEFESPGIVDPESAEGQSLAETISAKYPSERP